MLRAIKHHTQSTDILGVKKVTLQPEGKDDSLATASDIFVTSPENADTGQNKIQSEIFGELPSAHSRGGFPGLETLHDPYPHLHAGQYRQRLSETNDITKSSTFSISDTQKDHIIQLYDEVFAELLPQVSLEQQKLIMNVVAQASFP